MSTDQQPQQPSAEAYKAFFEGRIRAITVGHDKAIAYTNLLVVAGYATFFGLWSIVRGDIAPVPKLIAVGSMGIAVMLFMLYEVWRMMMGVGIAEDRARAFEEAFRVGQSMEWINDRLSTIETTERMRLAALNRWWRPFLLVELVFSGIGILIFFAAIIDALIHARM